MYVHSNHYVLAAARVYMIAQLEIKLVYIKERGIYYLVSISGLLRKVSAVSIALPLLAKGA